MQRAEVLLQDDVVQRRGAAVEELRQQQGDHRRDNDRPKRGQHQRAKENFSNKQAAGQRGMIGAGHPGSRAAGDPQLPFSLRREAAGEQRRRQRGQQDHGAFPANCAAGDHDQQ